MNILVTGAKGFIGSNLIRYLKNKTNHNLFEFNRNDDIDGLINIVPKLDFVYHLAGVNRSNDKIIFHKGNVAFTNKLCEVLSANRKVKLLYASSIQASNNNYYGISKKKAEIICQDFEKQYSNKVYICRLPGIFGEGCKPNYNSVVATFCHNIAKNKEIKIIDKDKEIELVYISDLCEFFLSFLNNFDLENYKNILPSHHIKINELASIIKSFNNSLDYKPNQINPSQFKNNLFKTFKSYKEKNF